ncbi:hypothetical protein BX600DRAFT_470747 [Xylariales sp. PMI_506]|nr:hypothetical protein BX600DRAFT_470747 [Xylariales sp. PMI_506]
MRAYILRRGGGSSLTREIRTRPNPDQAKPERVRSITTCLYQRRERDTASFVFSTPLLSETFCEAEPRAQVVLWDLMATGLAYVLHVVWLLRIHACVVYISSKTLVGSSFLSLLWLGRTVR